MSVKLSTDPLFAEMVRDIAGLYLNPPERALVFCVDEKSQIQALDRTQPFRWTKSADDILATIKHFCLSNLKLAEDQKPISQISESGH